MSDLRKRRVRVTARSRRTALPGSWQWQVGTEMAAPPETRTPTGTGAQVAPLRVRMEAGRQRRRPSWHEQNRNSEGGWPGPSQEPAKPASVTVRPRGHPSSLPWRWAAAARDGTRSHGQPSLTDRRKAAAYPGERRLLGRLPPAIGFPTERSKAQPYPGGPRLLGPLPPPQGFLLTGGKLRPTPARRPRGRLPRAIRSWLDRGRPSHGRLARWATMIWGLALLATGTLACRWGVRSQNQMRSVEGRYGTVSGRQAWSQDGQTAGTHLRGAHGNGSG